MRTLPTDKAVQMYVGSWGEYLDSIGVSWEDEEAYYDDEFEIMYCDRCPDQAVCVIEPEEREDDCHFIRPLESTVRKEE